MCSCRQLGQPAGIRTRQINKLAQLHYSVCLYVQDCTQMNTKIGPQFSYSSLTFLLLRMNKAVTRGFEKDVGNRTTHHFLYPESAVDVDNGVSLVLVPFKLRDLEWLTSALSTGHIKMTYMRVKDRVKADKDKVSVFGYGADKLGNWHHYWEDNRYAGAFRKTGVHSADFETKVIHTLAQEGKIKLYL
ncbi:hypothetical protein XENOCAPTIV_006948 [Xenoophorus captivus]|uniref:Uncharacterized protein n=1 Tax=Xenoophorus captivus TaxID=1517983 RepID=A0ABV0QGW0_9TELE